MTSILLVVPHRADVLNGWLAGPQSAGFDAEVQQININELSGDEERFRHSNFRIIEGIRIPFAITLSIGGAFHFRLNLPDFICLHDIN
ncbi:MAG: hypothetical protein GVY36_01445 [Verrucomicrobia bacterium]|nr:hypothetical protein [Verrucomicrobiota bacterium]